MLYNRELSWLSFNERVMQEAQDKSVRLYNASVSSESIPTIKMNFSR